MLFYLTTLNLAKFLTEDAHKLKKDDRGIKSSVLYMLWNNMAFFAKTTS